MELTLIKDFFIGAYNLILYQPLFNALVLLYQYLPGHDFGIAVIILTILIRIVLYPLGIQAIKSQKILQELQPKLKEIQLKHKDDKEKQARATMELYKKEKINPLSGCLPLLLQLPILIALYQVFWKGLREDPTLHLYSFVANPGLINTSFLGIINLAQSTSIKINENISYLWPNIILVILAGVAQFFQTKMTTPKPQFSPKKTPDFSELMQKQMLYFFPVFMVYILWKLPSAISLYWLINSIFAIGQQYLIFKPRTKT